MNKSSYAIFGSLAGFAVGISVAALHLRHSAPLPPVSDRLLPELANGVTMQPRTIPISADRVRHLEREMSKIEADRKRFDQAFTELNTRFRERIAAELTPAQAQRFASAPAFPAPALQPVRENFPSNPARGQDVLIGGPASPPTKPWGPSAPAILPPDVLQSMLELTFVTWSSGNLSEDLDLTPEQLQRIRPLLAERRAAFLELADRTPPPSLRLLTLLSDLRKKQP